MNKERLWKRIDKFSKIADSRLISDREFVEWILDKVTAENRCASLEEVYEYLSPDLRVVLLDGLRQIRAENYRGWCNYVGSGMSEERQVAAAIRLREIVETMERSGIINLDE
jgi:hypothetical protein